MSKEKQIKEMAREMCHLSKECKTCQICDERYHGDGEPCYFQCVAKEIIKHGYRKQSEGYWFFTEYEYFTCSNCGKSHFNFCDSSAEARKRLAEGEYYPYCPECGAKMKGGEE